MKINPIAALAALALALAPAARLDAQSTPPAAPRAEAHAGHHAQHAQHAAEGMGCDHAAAGHAATPAMLLTHRAHAGLSDAQAARLQALRPDDAAGARAVLTAEQRTRMEAMHAAMAGAHQAHAAGGHAHGDCADCCKDGACDGEGCCKDSDCCAGGRCDAQKCRECCARMNAAAPSTQAPPRS
ncbi:MAG: hypothetical protein ABW277_26920 [Longimicrobiaceae bacterium]